MTDEKILEVLDRYEADTSARGVGLETDAWLLQSTAHLHGMIPQMRQFLAEGRREKLMRWLGFIQGTLHAHRVYTLDELKDHVKP